jgi:hypothetical protein
VSAEPGRTGRLSQGARHFIEFMDWGFLVFCVGVGILFTALFTLAMTDLTRPTTYSEGYCAALGGTRLTDEECNVDGKVVTVVKR